MNEAPEPADIARVRELTNRNQSDAADPAASAWVSANAGTGKTHVLTRRVLRLLLSGTAPERILCLTYTKAAAAEMSTRVFRELGFWVTKSASDLQAALTALLGRAPAPEETDRARTLFAKAIETPGGLKVQTIHAFCERLLKRFPLEAGVSPGFMILDEVTAAQLLTDAIDDTLGEGTAQPGSPLGRALAETVAYAADDSFDEVLRQAIKEREWLAHVVRNLATDDDGKPRDPFAAVETLYRRAASVGDTATSDAIDAQRRAVLSDADIREAILALSGSGKTGDKMAEVLAAVLDGRDRIATFCEVLLTRKFTGRSDDKLVVKAVRERHPAIAQRLLAARDRLETLTQQRRGLDVVTATVALLRIADAVLTRYAKLKARRAALDFDDLIRLTANLLANSDRAQWVLYKLDGGLDHILVDESQDTSPDQWRIIEPLAMEFFAGTGAREETRTLFAVGDEKQSIYSFQGARPEEFARMGARFREAAAAARVAWRDIPLHLSFRTVAPILDAVDAVFASDGRTPGLSAGGSRISHAANRIGQAGLVEMWETERPADAVKTDAWEGDDDEAETAPAIRLAHRIADRIKHLVEGGERLASSGEPITAGDILILVRKRNPFAGPMVAALKARGIPVAGADRLTLTDQIAVQDLVALGDFLTLPEDDLALANVLKSPLFGFDDDQLFQIAHARRGTLWKALLDRRSEHPAFEEAAAQLREWRRRADFQPPYEFLAGVLERDAARKRLLGRLGPEAADSIDELLNMAIAFDEGAPPSLTGFLHALRESEKQIKRDMEHGRNEVRVMTVHGAKGLEAPVVFLPDTCSTRGAGNRPHLYPLSMRDMKGVKRDAFVWQIKGSGDLPLVAAGKSEVVHKEREERNRLLYVAMTRARDRLYVAGFEGRNKLPGDSWYSLIRETLADRMDETSDAEGRRMWRYASEQTAPVEKKREEHREDHAPVALEAWASNAAPREPQLTMPLAPSRLAPYDVDDAGDPVSRDAAPSTSEHRLEEPSAASPRYATDQNRFLRGTITHALLEHLPSIPIASWRTAAAGFVARRASTLPKAIRDNIVEETLAVLDGTPFAALFGPDSRAEVPIAAELPRPHGRGPALRLNGQIDRLAVLPDRVLVIDYKTNRPPPTAVAGIADAYLFQLAAYRLALSQLFSGRHVSTAILWTDGPRLMEIPEDVISRYEERLWDLDPSNLDAP